MFDCLVERLVDHFMSTPSTVDKKFGIERLKTLGVTTFEGTTNPTDVDKWFNLIKNCFGVMECLKEGKTKLATFLL